ncbi:unnamed protein product [Paramecium sonneborni]|uniref:Transmembrane protein n=1 Tax=Paramecium sonneborni TaxID=65129 RepID=A0A8S1R6V7_9CILI|nr:unnamed protein product [Paramecium sonneborni]
METNTKDNGKMVQWMEWDNLYGQMEKNIQDNMQKVKNMDLVNINIQTKYILVFLEMDFKMVQDYLKKEMVNILKLNGIMGNQIFESKILYNIQQFKNRFSFLFNNQNFIEILFVPLAYLILIVHFKMKKKKFLCPFLELIKKKILINQNYLLT